MTEFGKALRQMRVNSRLTQSDVRKKTGIHEDTLRKLENGTNIPKYETLEVLSTLYKTDLLAVLQSKRTEDRIYDYYQRMDKVLVNNSLDELNALREEFIAFSQSQTIERHLLNQSEIVQFTCFIECCHLLYSEHENRFKDAQTLIQAYMETQMSVFNESVLENYQFNDIEIRLIFMLGTIQMELENYTTCVSYLSFVIHYLYNNLNMNSQTYLLIIKGYTNLSYCYHLLKQHEKALEYANKGIEFGVTHTTFYMLQHLYGRKAVAELNLKDENYMDSFKKCIMLFEVSNQHDLANTYKSITLEKYGIDLYHI